MTDGETGEGGPRPGREGHAPPPPGGGAVVQVIPAFYDFILWMAAKVGRFPRVHRFTVGDRVMTTSLEVLDRLLEAQFDRKGRRQALHRANLDLERLRYLVRLSRDLNCISLKHYDHAARRLVEVGRQVGGWLRHSRDEIGHPEPGRSS